MRVSSGGRRGGSGSEGFVGKWHSIINDAIKD